MSGRIRTVKPEWLEDEKLAACSDAARMLSVGLMLLADDHGRGRAHPLFLASRVWAYGDPHETLTRLEGALSELALIGFVSLYSVGGQRYFAITNWLKHQKVQHPSGPRVPPPEDGSSEPPTPPTGTDREKGQKETQAPVTTAQSSDRQTPGAHKALTLLMTSSGDSHEVLTPDPDPDLDPDPDQDQETSAASAARADARSVVRGQVSEVFEHWRRVMGKTQAAKLDDKRRRRIEWGLKGYGLELCKRAIDGCAASPFNMGRNDDGKRYDDIGLIFRDAERFERFATVGAESGGRRAVVSADVVAGSRPDSAYAEAKARAAKVARDRAEAVAPPVDLARLLKGGIGRAMP